MITDHARLLAREVVTRACEMHTTGQGPDDLAKCRDIVLDVRWPIRGRGGVARAHARTQREVRAAITEFYQTSEPKEPNA